MSKCNVCRKNDALNTRWDRIRYRLFLFLFPKDIIDLSQDKFTQGFGDGYMMGFDHGKSSPDLKIQNAKDLYKMYEREN